MRKDIRTLLAAVIALFCGVAGAAPPPPPMPRDQLDRLLTRTITPALARDHVAGVTVAVVQGGQVIALRGFGRAGIAPDRPVDPARTLFGLASVSKVFTWTALLQAVEAERVDLNRDVNAWLPPALRYPAEGMRRPIRVIDLLRHTPGFEDRDVTILSQAAYGGRFPTLIERDILRPLGMTGTTLRQPYSADARLPAPMPADLAARRTQNLQWDGERFAVHPFEFMFDSPASGISTTAADMARLMLAQLGNGVLNGRQIYGPATARRFRTPLFGGAQSNGWAHGLMMRRLPGGYRAYGHDGGTSTTAAVLYVVPELDLGIFAAANNAAGGELVWTLPDTIVRAFYAPQAPGPAHPRPGSPALVREADRYDGQYLTMRRPHAGLAKLVYFEPVEVSVDSVGYLHAPGGGRDRRWVPAGSPGAFVDAEGEDVMAFTFGADGRADSWRDPRATRTYQRVSPLLATSVMLALLATSVLAALGILGAAAWRRLQRQHRPAAPLARRWFDRAQLALACAVLGAMGCIGWTVTHIDMASGAPFPPPALRGFALLMCLAAMLVMVLAALAPALWRAGGGWRRGPRLAACVPVALLALWLGNAGGLSFWD